MMLKPLFIDGNLYRFTSGNLKYIFICFFFPWLYNGNTLKDLNLIIYLMCEQAF